ncbi:MAG TPA: precorrin-8X methylmutase [Lachnospiraceae bacterium]|nr:precorrin-8X methylmutase [Lachnospiraceae bacterium]MDD7664672.1 precorrin-8X methylmutase [Lachnospiraceae bacterium]MDY4164814.1 precorrin-8X methylmutase [Lachnospiraceae bacterium]HAP02559.1 precorrin-8X methylmutase [Lachnospiraceae bacterium]
MQGDDIDSKNTGKGLAQSGESVSSEKSDESEKKEFCFVKPAEIEKESFRIIGEELDEQGISLEKIKAPYIMRCIHTSADFSYAKTLYFSKNAIEILEGLIRQGASIICDTNMALAGVNKTALKKNNCEAHCFMADERIREIAQKEEITRAAASMQAATHLDGKKIFAIGNAPTALIELDKLHREQGFVPDFIIGVPVGFVNVEYAKELIIKSGIPCIVNRGRKGGSNIAACLVNAALYSVEHRTL